MMRREIEVEEWTCRAERKRKVREGGGGRLIRGYNEVDGNPCTDNFISAVVNPLSIPHPLFLRHLLHTTSSCARVFHPSRSYPSFSLSLPLSLSLSLPSRSLRGNFFDKLFSAFFASGCKLNPPWRLEEACISRLPPGSRPPSRSPACSSPPPSPSSPPVHQPSRRIQSRLGRDTGYIIISRFSCGIQKRERERERQ